jgi:hypothetical protein
MKRFNIYETDQHCLMDIYSNLANPGRVRSVVITESSIEHPVKAVEIFTQKKGRGADQTFKSKECRVLSDDGESGMVLNATSDSKTIHVTTTKDSSIVKVVSPDGLVEDEFVTKMAPRISNGMLTIINIDEV